MAIERLLIAGALVAEERSERLEPRAVEDQPVPEIVPALVAEMPQKGAVGLLLQRALRFAVHVIGFGDVDGDESVVVPGESARRVAVRGVFQKLEREPFTAAVLRHYRQTQPEERVQHATLGDL